MASAHARYNKSKQDKPSFKCGREESNGVFNRRKGAAEPSALLDHRESQEAPCPTFISSGIIPEIQVAISHIIQQ